MPTETELKRKIEVLKKEVGDANGRLMVIEGKNKNLKTNNEKLIKTNKEIKENLTKSNEALEKAETLINDKKTEDTELLGIVDGTISEMEKLKNKITDLENLNNDLIKQNEELQKLADENKAKSSSVLTKSLAILGVFAGGAWVIVGVKEIWERLSKPPTSE